MQKHPDADKHVLSLCIPSHLNPHGGTLIFSYIYVGSVHFLGSKILNFNILGGFQKKINLGVWRFCGYFLGVIAKLDYI